MRRKVEIPLGANPMRLSDWLSRVGHSVPAPCGGRGVCGKCKVRAISGEYRSVVDGEVVSPDAEGMLLACQVECPALGGVVEVEEDVGSGLTEFSGGSVLAGGDSMDEVGVALDIGTTTLAAALVALSDGHVLGTASALNPQSAWGADVINRIGACASGHLEAQQKAVLGAVTRMLEELRSKAPGTGAPKRMMVAGNPTMLHLFAGISPEGMGHFPFEAAFLERKVLLGEEVGLPVEEVVLLPSASAFIGSDVLGGVLTCRMTSLEEPSVLMDIGTNGEMILCTGRAHGNFLYGVSAAAGPALEGANISCGVGGVTGAVSSVRRNEVGQFVFKTIGDEPPIGICGCGLADFVAELVEHELVDETGVLEDETVMLSGIHETKEGIRTVESTSVALTQKDIREFQLAKSAMRAGFEALVAHGCVGNLSVKNLFIAGGLGYYLRVDSAVRVGLLPPKETLPDVEAVGNTSLAGAIRCLVDPSALQEMDALASQCTTFNLNESAVFNEAFIEHMLFE